MKKGTLQQMLKKYKGMNTMEYSEKVYANKLDNLEKNGKISRSSQITKTES